MATPLNPLARTDKESAGIAEAEPASASKIVWKSILKELSWKTCYSGTLVSQLLIFVWSEFWKSSGKKHADRHIYANGTTQMIDTGLVETYETQKQRMSVTLRSTDKTSRK